MKWSKFNGISIRELCYDDNYELRRLLKFIKSSLFKSECFGDYVFNPFLSS